LLKRAEKVVEALPGAAEPLRSVADALGSVSVLR
jgi:hypothetical protein